MKRYFTIVCMMMLILFFGAASKAQENLMELVRDVQENTQKTHDNIESVLYSGYSRFQVYVGWNAMGLNFLPLTEEYHFNGVWMKPDSVRLEIVAFHKATPDTGMGFQEIEEGMPLPNPFTFSYDASALGTDEEDRDRNTPRFRRNDFENIDGLIQKLKKNDDPVSVYLWESFTDSTKNLIDRYDESDEQKVDMRRVLRNELNEILNSKDFYSEERFAHVELTEQTLRLIESDTEGDDLRKLNRLLLEDAYLKEVRQRQKSISVGAIVRWPLFPFAVGADSIYNYELVSEIGFGSRKIFELYVTPKYANVPGVIGTFQVDPDEKAVVGADVVFNEAAEFLQMEVNNDDVPRLLRPFISIDEDHRLKTKMGLVYSEYWLPESTSEDFFVKIWGIKAKISREIYFTSYAINETPPDTSDFPNVRIVMNRDTLLEKEIFKDWQDFNVLPVGMEDRLVKEAEKAFASFDLDNELFDSESLIGNALSERLGGRGQKYFRIAQQYGDNIIYNRVEGLQLNYRLSVANSFLRSGAFAFKGGYGFGDDRWKGEASLLHYFDRKNRFFIEGNIFDTINSDESRQRLSTTKNTISSFFFNTDYRDYYYKKGGSIGLGMKITDNFAVKLSGISQTEETAENHVKFSLTRIKTPFRLNPEIMEGDFRGLRMSFLYNTGSLNADIHAEYTDRENLHSDFAYSTLRGRLSRTMKVDKLNSFYVSLAGMTSDGDLPSQRWFDFGGKSFLNYNGNLRGTGYKAFTGDRALYGTVEYMRYLLDMFDFTAEDTRWNSFRRTTKITLWTGFGWSELLGGNRVYAAGIRTPSAAVDDWYHEFGVGISDRFNFFRLDFIRNSISKNNIQIGFNILR
ncbi:DUF5686 family protein [candidate division KSB1 bacterium]